MPSTALASPETPQAILEWLTGPPHQDPREEAAGLHARLDALYHPTIPHAQFHTCIELFYSRCLRLAGEHRKTLRSATQPLAPEALTQARGIAELLQRVATGFARVLEATDARATPPQQRLAETIAARALRLLSEHFLTQAQAGLTIDAEIWRSAYRLYRASAQDIPPHASTGSPAETALFAYKRLLALASLEPQSLSPAEIDWAGDYLSRAAGQVHVQAGTPPSLEGAWFWLDAGTTNEPQACVRREPPQGRSLLFFSTSGLARRAAEQLARHNSGRNTSELAPDAAFPDIHPAALLERLAARWASPPRRSQPRRPQDYEVKACLGLHSIWHVLREPGKPGSGLISTWRVTNESPGGYAIMQLQGQASGLNAGMAIALRREARDPWNICIVRWLRSDSENQVEIGLQMVSRGAIPVRVGFRGAPPEQGTTGALVLPVLPALRQHQAIMAPAGTYVSRRFSLVSDIDRLYVAQCRLLTLDQQTAAVELFQFEVDPYPI